MVRTVVVSEPERQFLAELALAPCEHFGHAGLA